MRTFLIVATLISVISIGGYNPFTHQFTLPDGTSWVAIAASIGVTLFVLSNMSAKPKRYPTRA